ncbi:MAG: Lrp/AsnC family transcriptional regulator [Oceanospirillaceae bacterium]|nr:Lrp/AsnC family transcriptional regulator [Oceanospirillaceae bacterium]
MTLDNTDKLILKLIQSDASMPASEIAERVNLTQPPCWRRIKRLEEAGFIIKRAGILDPKKLGLHLVIYAEVKLTANSELEAFEEEVKKIPEVTECYIMLGQVDFLLRIVTTDIAGYEKLYRDQLAKLPGLQELNSSVAMSEVKRSTDLPITLN